MTKEFLQIDNAIKYLEEFRFDLGDLSDWEKKKQASDQVLGKLILYSLALGISSPDTRQAFRVESIQVPKTTSPSILINSVFGQIAETQKLSYLRPELELISASHLFVPYVFPYVLNILSQTEQLTESGLKSLTVQALENGQTTIDPEASESVVKNTPPGIFESPKNANAFLFQLADNFRESFSKTKSTMHDFKKKHFDPLSVRKDLILTQNPSLQTAVIEDLKEWFKPKELPSLEKVNWLVNQGFIKEDPKRYLQRIATLRKNSGIMYRGLTET
ncbi:MAG: hypothetical protein UX85_C0007G0007 [Candidatus Beckwithbacteria bacterium GW2011_GWB1_47_15]|uniref:Uncharacterized protein n=1 Tax=Candidatus Beckwithbacteria bacterium GW2011_GWB1_47_15 TaxID=1618371 RepID=A0A0G1USL6_9BACT|nr:MAG: hypothetical protein UY43_C0001G0577 [Candidatus Beckwithbacteria bacterium GW2011_GWC1_49_16]KKU35076.1 MAG: hypothetical protein UX50_C0006G0002 [Candidatus Beckwithbacteria bacterium GW2011_GWA1_46_30]KKU60720.1 MAG: hypothetical protein UX85_C0007G0007 [Candidatus Beckwithbacteria bacterium GW2011_GWB1_47_15]KKU71525.1 MAG: hypothetical protein UX97_C0005G0008 [Candidatus Beckwithbacteria bacterium GW2011_GWA2_47_25]KKW03522.1 MAG: hypothetical protein UY37_C0005G0085 [Candidatus Be